MNFFSLLIGSFYSAHAYREARASGKFYMGYAALVVLLCTLSVTLFYAQFIHREIFVPRAGKPALFDDVVKQISRQLPVMSLNENQLMSNEIAPTVIAISGTAFGMTFDHLNVITIDTSGQTTHETMQTPILINAKEFIFKSDKETKIKSIAELTKDGPKTLVINQAVAESLADEFIASVHGSLMTVYLVLGIIAWFFISAYMFLMRMVMLLLLGVMGLAIGSLLKSPINYTSAVALAAVSYTPIALLDTVLFAGLHYPTSPLVMMAAGTVALYAAIKCSHPPSARQLVG